MLLRQCLFLSCTGLREEIQVKLYQESITSYCESFYHFIAKLALLGRTDKIRSTFLDMHTCTHIRTKIGPQVACESKLSMN